MHLNILFSLFVLALADFNTFQDVYSLIATAMDTFDQTIMKITHDSPTIRALTPAAAAVLEAINSGTKIVAATPSLEPTDMSLFMVTSRTLVNAANVTIMDLESKKDIIGSTTARGIVLQTLTRLKTATQSFMDMVLSKVPEDTKALVKDQENDVIGSLEQGVSIFS
jgi:hypothetical protein